MFWKKRINEILLAAIVAGMLGFGLWPFDFRPKNKVEWIRDGNGLRFDGENHPLKKTSGGVAVMPLPLGVVFAESGDQGEFTLGLWLEPAEGNMKILITGIKEMLGRNLHRRRTTAGAAGQYVILCHIGETLYTVLRPKLMHGSWSANAFAKITSVYQGVMHLRSYGHIYC